MKLKNLLLLITVAALLIAPAGCIFSPDEKGGGGDIDTGLPDPTTKDQLMKNFETIYEEMDIDEFTKMLHEDYKTLLLSSTLTDWDWADDFYFDRTIEVEIHTNLFGGATGLTPDGNTVHPIDSIVVELLEQQGDWDDIPDTDEYFGGYGGEFSSYQVWLQFWDAANEHKFEVQQEVIFYVAPVDVDGRVLYRMLGQKGLPPVEG